MTPQEVRARAEEAQRAYDEGRTATGRNEVTLPTEAVLRMTTDPRLQPPLTAEDIALIRQRLDRLREAGLPFDVGDVLDARWLATLGAKVTRRSQLPPDDPAYLAEDWDVRTPCDPES